MAVLQHDVGDRTLFDVLHEDREEGLRLYRGGHRPAGRLSSSAGDCGLNAPFTAEFFFNELKMAREFYVEQLMGGARRSAGIAHENDLPRTSPHHPYVLCHRDFHGQNLHVVQ